MKTKIIFLIAFCLSTTQINSMFSNNARPMRPTEWQWELANADALRNRGQLTRAAEGYRRLIQDRAIGIPANERLQELEQNPAYINMAAQEAASAAQQTIYLQQLAEADRLRAEGNYAAAAALYSQLADAPHPHYYIHFPARRALQEMRDAGQIQ